MRRVPGSTPSEPKRRKFKPLPGAHFPEACVYLGRNRTFRVEDVAQRQSTGDEPEVVGSSPIVFSTANSSVG